MNATPPHDAKNRYLKDKFTDVTDSTLSNYQSTLDGFCDWLTDEAGVKTLNTLTSDEIQQFKEWRLEQVKTITLKTDMTCIKDFIRFCEHINAVPDGLHLMVRVPKPNHEDEVASRILTRQEARHTMMTDSGAIMLVVEAVPEADRDVMYEAIVAALEPY